MNGWMYRLWHSNIALPPVKIVAGIIVIVGGGTLYLYNVGIAVLVSSDGIQTHLPHVSSPNMLHTPPEGSAAAWTSCQDISPAARSSS